MCQRGEVGAVASVGLACAIDCLSGVLWNVGCPGTDEFSMSALLSILHQIPDGFVEARTVCE